MSEIVPIEVGAARRLTERIRLVAMTVGDNIAKLKTLVAEAKASEAHVALGYPSWTAYLADVLGDTPMRLERDVRQALVAELSDQGMSTRAIAPIVGASQRTVANDVSNFAHVDVEPAALTDEPGHVTKLTGSDSVAVNVTPDLAPRIDDWVQPGVVVNTDTGEVTEVEPPATRAVTGLDGKTYNTPAAHHKAQRKALTDTAKDVGWELRKATERLQRIWEDDRFSRNKNEVAAHIRGHLMFTVEVCQDLLDVLNQS